MHKPFERQPFEPKVSIVTGGASGSAAPSPPS